MENIKFLEKEIEAKVCEYAKSKGTLCYKFVSPNTRSVPDRIFFYKGFTLLIEFKSTVGKTTSGQDREIKRLREQGMDVHVINDIDTGKLVIDEFVKFADFVEW